MAGAVGCRSWAKLADGYLAEALPASTARVLQRVNTVSGYVARAQSAANWPSSVTGSERLRMRSSHPERAGGGGQTGSINNDLAATPARGGATAIRTSRWSGSQAISSRRSVGLPASLSLRGPRGPPAILVFGLMYLRDRRWGAIGP